MTRTKFKAEGGAFEYDHNAEQLQHDGGSVKFSPRSFWRLLKHAVTKHKGIKADFRVEQILAGPSDPVDNSDPSPE